MGVFRITCPDFLFVFDGSWQNIDRFLAIVWLCLKIYLELLNERHHLKKLNLEFNSNKTVLTVTVEGF